MNTPDDRYESIAQYLVNVKSLLQNLTIELGRSPLTPLDKGGTGFPPLVRGVGGDILTIAFGDNYDRPILDSILTLWNNGDFSNLPEIEVISSAILGNANGGYSQQTNTIYLADTFLNNALPHTIEGVILEEIGHWVDAQINTVDPVWDEGAVFADLTLTPPTPLSQRVRGESSSLTPWERVGVRVPEDDSATITIAGQEVAIEMSSGFTHPMPGSVVTSGLNGYPGHTGLDLDYTTANLPPIPYIQAAKKGKVIEVVSNVNRNTYKTEHIYGNYIKIDHGDGYQTLYGHLKSVSVSKNQEVDQGQIIGVMGNTGDSSSDHLHFEIRHVSSTGGLINYEDPWPLINGSLPPSLPSVTTPDNNALTNYPIFDAGYYLSIHSDVAAAYGSTNYEGAKSHWILNGIKEGRKSSPFFDAGYYLSKNPDVAAAYGSTNYEGAAGHWLQYGINEGRRASTDFDPIYYMAAHPDVEAAFGVKNFRGAMDHYLIYGRPGGWYGSEWITDSYVFNVGDYLYSNPDVAAGVNTNNLSVEATRHWYFNGINEGRRGSVEFDSRYYLAAHPDVRAAFGATNYRGAMDHYLIYGKPGGWIGANDATRYLSVNDVGVTEGDGGTQNATFTVTLDEVSGQTIYVNYSNANDSAVDGSDYYAVSGTLTFNPGENTKTISVAVIGDTLDENNEQFTLNLSSPTNANLSRGQGFGIIYNNDPAPNLSIDDVPVTEGDSGSQQMNFTVSLSGPSSKTIYVNYNTANDSAADGSDYSGVSGTLTFNPGDTIKYIPVSVLGDFAVEGNEQFTMNLSSPSNAGISRGQGFGIIYNNDVTPNITINDVSVTEGDSGSQNATFTVNLSNPSNINVTVNYSTANDSAGDGSDYSGVSGTLTFTPGQTSQTINVPVLGDTLDEDDERFFVNLSGAANGNITDSQGIGTIVDNEGTPTITINDVTVTEGNSGSQAMTFTVSLSNASSKAVSIAYNTDYIYNGRKYTLTNGAKTWEQAQFEALQMGGNLVTLNNAAEEQWLQSTFGTSQYFIIGLTDKNSEGNFTWISGEPVTYSNWNSGEPNNAGGAENYGMMNGPGWNDIPATSQYYGIIETVQWYEYNGKRYTLTSDAKTWEDAQLEAQKYGGNLVTINNVAEEQKLQSIFGTNQSFWIGLTDKASEGNFTWINGEPVTYTNWHPNEPNNGQGNPLGSQDYATMNYDSVLKWDDDFNDRVTRFGIIEVNSPLPLTNQATGGSDYTITNGTLTFNAGETTKTITVPILGDTTDEVTERLKLTLSNPSNATISDSQGVGTIIDNDVSPAKLIAVDDLTNKSLKFNGITDYVEIPHNDSLSLSKFTIETSFKLSDFQTNWIPIITKQNSIIGTERSFGFFIHPTNHTIHYSFNNSDNSKWLSYDSNTAIKLNEWTNIAMTYDGSNFNLYINGVLDSSQAVTDAPFMNNYPVKIGTELDNNYSPFKGEIDEVRIWNVARTQSEIQTNLEKSLTGKESGLVAYYNFNEDSGNVITDISNNNNHGVISGANWSESYQYPPITSIQNTPVNNGLKFDGIDDYVQIPNDSVFNFTKDQNFTVESWIKVDPNQADLGTNDNDIIEKWGHELAPEGYPFVIRYERNTGKISVKRYDLVNNPQIHSTINVNDGNFHHVAFVKDGNILKLYIDGKLDGETTDTTTGNTQNNLSLSLGRRGNNANYFEGEIDEVRIWNVARTQEQIQTNLYNNLTGKETGLVGYWNFNEGKGIVGADLTSNINHGIISGATWTESYQQKGIFTNENAAININVLANDINPDNGTITIKNVTTTNTKGLVTINADKTIKYNPNGKFDYLKLGEIATDTFSYTITNTQGAIDTATVTVQINGVNESIINGTTGADNLVGSSSNDLINGLEGNDTLNGGGGVDTLKGGLGNDVYIVDTTTDTITENLNEGTDTVQSSVTYTLGSNLENLTLTGTGVINGTGNTLNNTITGNTANNTLEGGTGIDTLKGGLGNDIYVIDSTTDTITENLNEGTDQVNSSITYTLGSNLENLTLTGTGVINGTGNALNNTITGNTANNTLDGGTGNDTLIGGLGNDVYILNQKNKEDLLWRNKTTGEVRYWYMDNTTTLGNVSVATIPTAWDLVGTGDFNQDNKDDLLWRNKTTGEVKYWYMDNTTILGNVSVATVSTAWNLVGTGDFNQDNKDDLLWRNQTTGEVRYWYMDNTTKLGDVNVATVSTAWNLVGTGDFNQDNKDDLLWRNQTTGEVRYWYMDQTKILGNVSVTTDTAWDLVGTADFNQDNKDDLLWRNQTTGQVRYWYMDNTTKLSEVTVTTVSTAWELVGTGDFNNTTIRESVNQGTDTVQSSVSYTLASNFENLILTGTTALNGTGNALNNTITGNTANNILNGGAGNDTLDGGVGTDTGIFTGTKATAVIAYSAANNTFTVTTANGGVDTVRNVETFKFDDQSVAAYTTVPASSLDAEFYLAKYTDLRNAYGINKAAATQHYVINGYREGRTVSNQGNDNLIGSAFNDSLNGGAGNDTLNGLGGVDTLKGGLGNDIYVVDTTTDTITENLNEGTDQVNSSVTYTLGNNLENLTLTGTGVINGTGNALNNTITGNTANNTLDGGTGNDTLIGGLGNDVYILNQKNKEDLLWRNKTTGEVRYWYMDNTTTLGDVSVATVSTPWDLVGTADFNQDNKDDLLWRNKTTGEVKYWYMDNTTILGNVSVATVSTAGNLVGTGDFNQDNKDDLLWRNQTTGEVRYWYMDNTTKLGDVSVATVSTAWNLVGTGDFNQDGKDDLLWRNKTTGQVRYWYMDQTKILSNVSVTTDTAWDLVGTADFNQDNKDDLLWRNQTTGQVRYWYMDNTTKLSEVTVTTVSTAWELVGTGDFNNTTIRESVNQGTDTVQSSVSYTLASNFENLILTGTTAINGTGNALNNTITGNTANNILNGGLGADTLNGGGGDDLLFGGQGNDNLTGAAGLDKFYFSNVTNFSSLGVDTLTDFAKGSDKLVLSKTLFTSVGDSLIASELATIATSSATELGVAGSSSAFIVYNSTTGNLFYNPDGATAGLINGGQFATLSNKPILGITDFTII